MTATQDRCQAQFYVHHTEVRSHDKQCPNQGDKYQCGGDGTALLITYLCPEHAEAVARESLRQWRKA